MIDLRRTILFVDDDPHFLAKSAAHFGGEAGGGFRVLTATNEEEARRLLREHEIDIVLLDVRLHHDDDPTDISGLLFSPEAGALTQVILFSHHLHDNESLWRQTLNYRVDSVISKTEPIEILLAEIHRLLATAPFGPAKRAAPAPALDIDAPTLPTELLAALADNDVVLFAGSGIRSSADARGQAAMAKDLLRLLRGRPDVDQEAVRGLSRRWRDGQVESTLEDALATLMQSKGGPALLTEYWQVRFPPASLEASKMAGALLQLPLAGVITTDLDPALKTLCASAVALTTREYGALEGLLPQRKAFLLQLAGDPRKPETVRLTSNQWRRLLQADPGLHEALALMFDSRTILFVGYTLEELAGLLDALRLGKPARPHFALTPINEPGWETRAEDVKRWYGVRLLPFNAANGASDAVVCLVEARRALGDEKALAARLPGRKERSLRLSRLRLSNIGPFDALELTLDRRWSVLLGENGSGASTVLKAIAFALCGAQASHYAQRLLKTGATHGQIDLEFEDGAVNRIELKRDGGEARELEFRDLSSEQWLALALPPLRFIDAESPRAAETVYPPPRTVLGYDLAPLLDSPLDPRMNEIKQLLLDLRFEGARRGRRLMEMLFETHNQIAVGAPLRFDSVGPDGMPHVRVADAQPVPLPALSQGMTGLLGWVGLLLRRLREVYSESEDPRREAALVLIDEIDAHMDPEWQRALIPHLSELFPNTQFVASTHSPLVADSLAGEKVWLLSRGAPPKHPPMEVATIEASAADQPPFEKRALLDR